MSQTTSSERRLYAGVKLHDALHTVLIAFGAARPNPLEISRPMFPELHTAARQLAAPPLDRISAVGQYVEAVHHASSTIESDLEAAGSEDSAMFEHGIELLRTVRDLPADRAHHRWQEWFAAAEALRDKLGDWVLEIGRTPMNPDEVERQLLALGRSSATR